MEYCKICEMPQPSDKRKSLHYDDCKNHNMRTCVACEDLLEEERYEELARVKEVERKQKRP